MAANKNNNQTNPINDQFNHIKACMAAGVYWGVSRPLVYRTRIEGCLDLIRNHLAGITDKDELTNALKSVCWQIVIAKGYGTTAPKNKICVITKDSADILIDAMEKAVGSSGFSIKPDDIFDYDEHKTVKSLLADLRDYYADAPAHNIIINRSPKMYSYRADRWDADIADGIMAIDEPLLGDLSSLSDEDIESKMSIRHKRTPWEWSNPLKDLARNIRKGDIIIAREGGKKVLGFGVVKSDYYYDTNARDFKHRREVEWTERPREPMDYNVRYMLAGGNRKIRIIDVRSLYRMFAKKLGIASCNKTLNQP
ncbi:MAG: hypothetical protein IIZ25_06665 [Thermoguttaceae bacterium]|nr:hypothetical protein [Thermoguttaceae bacterium]